MRSQAITTVLPISRRSQAERRDQSEQALLIAAAEVIGRDGVNAATFEAIGKLAGYSRGLVTARFGSKDGLVRALVDFLSAQLAARFEERISSERSPLACLLAFNDVMLSEVESDPLLRAYFVMMAGAVGNRSALQEAFLATHDGVRDDLRGLIEAGQAAGEMDPHLDANTVALSIGSLHLGISVELLLDPALDMAAMRNTVNQAVLRMVSVRAG